MPAATQAAQIIQGWPEESREPAQLVIDRFGEPDEATDTQLTWHRQGPWKRIVATKSAYPHNFPTSRRTAWRSTSCTTW